MGGILIIKVVLFFRFGHQGASLFSKWKADSAVLGIRRGQMAKIRILCICKWGGGGYLFNKSGLGFSFHAPGCKLICFVYLFVEGSGAQARIPARAVSRLSAQSSNKRVPIT